MTRPRLATAATIVLLSMGTAACGDDRPSSAAMPSVQLAAMSSSDGALPSVMADDIEGPALINLWATWCGPCRVEMPAFQTVADDTSTGVTIVGVNEGDQSSAAQTFVDDLNVTFPQYLDPDGALIDQLRIAGLPATIVVNGDGDIVSVHSGALDEAGIRSLIADATS